MAVGNLSTMLGDTITLPSQACGRGQLSDDAWGQDYVLHRKFVAVGNLATMLGDTNTLPSQACGRGQLGDDAWGHDYVTIASLWP